MVNLESKIKERTEQLEKINGAIEQIQGQIADAQARLNKAVQAGQQCVGRLAELKEMKERDNADNSEVPETPQDD